MSPSFLHSGQASPYLIKHTKKEVPAYRHVEHLERACKPNQTMEPLEMKAQIEEEIPEFFKGSSIFGHSFDFIRGQSHFDNFQEVLNRSFSGLELKKRRLKSLGSLEFQGSLF